MALPISARLRFAGRRRSASARSLHAASLLTRTVSCSVSTVFRPAPSRGPPRVLNLSPPQKRKSAYPEKRANTLLKINCVFQRRLKASSCRIVAWETVELLLGGCRSSGLTRPSNSFDTEKGMCCSVQYPAITKDVGGKASFSNSRLKGRCRPSGGAEDGSRRRSHTASQRRSDELEMWNNCQFCRQYSGSDSRKRKANRGAQNLHKCLGRGGIRTHGTVTRTPDFESGWAPYVSRSP